uniref:Large ribosomal subunit protein uL24 C-terminal domain-containing protein n=1 Tax=Ananas comosus var. bracteatus TaxID=296719 RepID=A0A6V7NXN2_ANACO|nr:unnamed protein product [Ananas comosus var. bracteatus]
MRIFAKKSSVIISERLWSSERGEGERRKKTTTTTKMATIMALQSSMGGLSISNSISNSFFGLRLSPSSLLPFLDQNSGQTMCHSNEAMERKECKPNSLPVLHKMHVKVGDTVKIIAAAKRVKLEKLLNFQHNSTVIVKDMNLKTKHMKSREQGEPGQIVKIEAAIHSSNVMLYSKEQQVASRVGHKILEDGTRVRYLIKTGEVIDNAENWKKVIKERTKAKE